MGSHSRRVGVRCEMWVGMSQSPGGEVRCEMESHSLPGRVREMREVECNLRISGVGVMRCEV